MAKRLSIAQVEEMKTMILDGQAPEDIAKHFNVAISSVHNYKAKFKSAGLDVPNIRGKRPQGSVHKTKSTPVRQQSVIGVVNQKSTQQTENFKFIVNGVSVQISANAKSVNIDRNTMEINF